MFKNTRLKPGFRLRLKLRPGLWLGIFLVFAAAVGGAYFLGKLYLGLIKLGNVPQTTKVYSGGSRPVTAREDRKLLGLNPIPVYYLQAGVYSDLTAASEAAKPLTELGYLPYITRSAPYRIWVGVYQKRDDTEMSKSRLKDKGIGSFTGSVVLNGSSLRYGDGSEVLIKGIAPLLEAYTAWLKENLALFNADRVDRLDWSGFEKRDPVRAKLSQDIQGLADQAGSSSKNLPEQLKHLQDTVNRYEQQLKVFRSHRTPQNYAALQYCVLEVIDNYLGLWREINDLTKT